MLAYVLHKHTRQPYCRICAMHGLGSSTLTFTPLLQHLICFFDTGTSREHLESQQCATIHLEHLPMQVDFYLIEMQLKNKLMQQWAPGNKVTAAQSTGCRQIQTPFVLMAQYMAVAQPTHPICCW